MAQNSFAKPETCPRCNLVTYHSQRALSIHLAKCGNNNLFLPSLPKKQKRSSLIQLTNSQRAEQIFNSMTSAHISGDSVNTNRLLVIPPLSLSAFAPNNTTAMTESGTSSDFENDNNFDFEVDISETLEEHTNTSSSTNCLVNFSHASMNLPPGVKFGIHLQHILSSHRGVDLKLFDDITNLIKYHAIVETTNFSSVKLYQRNELTTSLSSLYNLHHLKPILHQVQLTDSSIVTVPIFDVKAVILSILHDTKRMQTKHFAHGYDLFSGKPTSSTTTMHEIHTGALWNTARNYYCRDTMNAFPLALVCFYDKTHTDLHGALSCAPFVMTFSFFNEKARSCDEFYSVLGYIPNLSYGSGQFSKKTAREKLQDEHMCLKLITAQIDALSAGFETTIMGQHVTVKPWIHFIAGDTSGHNNIVGQYNSSSATFPYRDCKCTCDQLSDIIPDCSLLTMEEYTDAKESGTLSQFSLHDIDNAFIGLPFADLTHGIFGCVPAEMLHVSGNGIMKYQLEIMQTIIGYGNRKQHTINMLDTLHRNLVRDALTQSEKDVPRMSDRNGVTDGTKMSASERVGNMFILLCAMHTEHGKQLFIDGCNESRISFNNMKYCIKLQLGFEKWVNEPNTMQDIDQAKHVISDLLSLIQTCFPRNNGNGWCIPKMHSLAKMTHYMKQFGCAQNFSGQVGERVLKTIVKNHAQQTQRRVNVFASQCADREFESQVYRYAYNNISDQLDTHQIRIPNTDTEFTDCKGKFVVQFSGSDLHGRGGCKVTWADNMRNKCNIPIHDLVTHALRTHACAVKWTKPFSVEGFTSGKINLVGYDKPILFHANDSLFGNQRYHYCFVNFDSNDEHVPHNTCPAQILAFVRFLTPGFPTPESTESEKNQDKSDTKLYAVIHTASNYLSWDEMNENFISEFTLGNIKTCVYIVDVATISDPLFVFRNYGKDSFHHLCSLPYRRWGIYFRNKL